MSGLLEGNEIDKQVGPAKLIVDVTPDLKVKASATVEIDVVAELEKLALKSTGTLDDKAVEGLKWVRALLQAQSI